MRGFRFALDTIIDMSGRVNSHGLSSSEERLFNDFVAEVRRMGLSPERAEVNGLSSRQLRRYLKEGGAPTRLEDDTKLAMSRFLASRGVSGYAPGSVDGGGGNERPPSPEEVRAEIARYRGEPHRDGVAWVPRLIEQVLEGTYEGRLKLALIEAIAAAGRNHTAYGEAMAAVQRGVAMETEGTAAVDRAAVNRRAEEKAPARAGLPEVFGEVEISEEEIEQLRSEGRVRHPLQTLTLIRAPHPSERKAANEEKEAS